MQPGSDLSASGTYAGQTVLFRDGIQTLASDVRVDRTTIAAGTTVCIDLFVTSEIANNRTWTIDYASPILAITRLSGHLADTDFLSASGVGYGEAGIRGVGNDNVSIRGGGYQLRLTLDVDDLDSVRIFIDCSS